MKFFEFLDGMCYTRRDEILSDDVELFKSGSNLENGLSYGDLLFITFIANGLQTRKHRTFVVVNHEETLKFWLLTQYLAVGGPAGGGGTCGG